MPRCRVLPRHLTGALQAAAASPVVTLTGPASQARRRSCGRRFPPTATCRSKRRTSGRGPSPTRGGAGRGRGLGPDPRRDRRRRSDCSRRGEVGAYGAGRRRRHPRLLDRAFRQPEPRRRSTAAPSASSSGASACCGGFCSDTTAGLADAPSAVRRDAESPTGTGRPAMRRPLPSSSVGGRTAARCARPTGPRRPGRRRCRPSVSPGRAA